MDRRGCGRSALAALALLALLALRPPGAAAVEFLDGRVQIHGYVESQVRVIAKSYDPGDGYDLTQWYNIVNVESEWDIAPDGFGPFDLVSAYVRVEARYDCVWTGGCGVLQLEPTYGDDAKRLPRRLSNAHKTGLVGVTVPGPFSDTRPWIRIPIDQRAAVYGAPAGLGLPTPDQRHVGRLWNVSGLGELFFAGRGPDLQFGTSDDPGLYLLDGCNSAFDQAALRPPGVPAPNDIPCLGGRRPSSYLFALQDLRGPTNGTQSRVLGPWRPDDRIPEADRLRDRANPLSLLDEQPVLGLVGQGQLPFRPAPIYAAGDRSAPRGAAQGVFVPNAAFQGRIGSERFGFYDQNFSESALAWNHGASQRSERELKEAYLDLELFEGRLWVRGGRQTIVWGKTEIFRSQDQWNPQDLGLSSLPSLEESRVPLWSVRGVWSFYDVGFLEDVRLELAANLDEFEPVDLGRCGEPYAIPATCTRAFGFFGYGLAGTGLAGEQRPASFWHDPGDLEWGARLEFREDRLSFALTWFRGYDDFPHVEPIFVFERNVDPQTGRPRRAGSRGRCDPDGLVGAPDTSGCLGSFSGTTPDFDLANPAQVQDVLTQHPANQQLFHAVCASTVGFSELLPEGCSLNVWNSTALALRPTDPLFPVSPRISMAFSAMLAGGAGTEPPNFLFNGKAILFSLGDFAAQGSTVITDQNQLPLVPLVENDGDGPPLSTQDLLDAGLAPDPVWTGLWGTAGLAPFLNQAQEALLGCGSSEGPAPAQSFTRRSFWGTHCDISGFDVMNTEGSAFFQSWPGFEGTEGGVWLANDASRAQPGTTGFVGGPVCTRTEGGALVVLPGCTENGGLLHPFTGQVFQSELAALSWNALMVFVTLSLPDDTDGDGVADRPAPGDPFFPYRFDEFDPLDPFRTDGCSYVNPSVCKNVANLLGLGAAQKRTVTAGGNGRFGRRDFQWAGGAAAVLEYQQRDVLGFAMDFAEDRTKTSWGLEFTWFPKVLVADNDAFDALARVDLYNLVVSVDRLTFIRFLNRSRSFFMNLQLFLQYVADYRSSFPRDGPFNTLATFTVATGYHQDRLVPSVTFVHDFPSSSGAVLVSVSYRYTENLSIQVGANAFYGSVRSLEAPLVAPGTAAGGAGRGAQRAYVENGLSQIRDRDEFFLRLRYTF